MSEQELFGPDFLIRRPLLEAIEADDTVVLLVDEIDRADEEFEAFLLEVLSDFQITIPELGTIRARRRPAVVLTSNRTRELHDALKRRCLFHWIDHPSLEREVEIVEPRCRGPSGWRCRRPRSCVRSARGPGEAAGRRRDDRLGSGAHRPRPRELDEEVAETTLGSLLKVREDVEALREGASPRSWRTRCRVAVTGGAAPRDLVSFGRLLRSGGAEVGPGRLADAVRGLAAVGLADRGTCTSRCVRRSSPTARKRGSSTAPSRSWSHGDGASGARGAPGARTGDFEAAQTATTGRRRTREGEAHARGASIVEILRRKDFALLDEDEVAEVTRLLAEVGRVRPRRTSRRLRPSPRATRPAPGRPPLASLGRRARRAPDATRRSSPASSSSSATSRAPWHRTRALLLFLHATAQAGHVEAFAFGTRLHRLTSDLAARPRRRARARVPQVVDWGSGTRIGASLKQFNDEYGRQALPRGRGRDRVGRLGARRPELLAAR